MYVELKDINKTFGDYKASDHVSFGIEKGKLIGLLRTERKRKNNDPAHDRRIGTAGQWRDHHRWKSSQ